MLSKEQFITLAEAATKQQAYEKELAEAIKNIAKKHEVDTDFLGDTLNTELIMVAIGKVLGEDFEYFLYECDASFREFNQRITLADGSHPHVENFGDLYDFCNQGE